MMAAQLGTKLHFGSEGVNEKNIVISMTGHDTPGVKPGDIMIAVDPRYFHPVEVEAPPDGPVRAHEKSGRRSGVTLCQMISEVVANDLDTAKKHSLFKSHGYEVAIALEYQG